MKERKNVFAKETVTVCDKCSGHMMYKAVAVMSASPVGKSTSQILER